MKKTILLVEDDAPVREIIREVLEMKYVVLEASSYLEAMSYHRTPFDLAVIDYVLPDGNGIDLSMAIREEKPVLPVILITAYNHENIILNALRAGVTDYMKKPLSLRYLLGKVSEILGEDARIGLEEPGSIGGRKDFIMDAVGEYIEKNYMKDLTLDRLS